MTPARLRQKMVALMWNHSRPCLLRPVRADQSEQSGFQERSLKETGTKNQMFENGVDRGMNLAVSIIRDL